MITTGRLVAFVAGIIFAAAASLLTINAMRSQPSPADVASQPANGDFIRTYLLKNPEIIRDALFELERRKAEAEQKERFATIDQNKSILFDSTRQAVLGNPKGDVTLVEFFDYNCGYCKRVLGDMNRLIDEYPNLRIVLKEFPVLGQGSVEAAQVATAVNMIAPEKYDAFHQALLTTKGRANGAKAIAVTEQIGIDQAALTKALKDPEIGATLDESYGLAKSLELTGTPSYVIGEEIVFGAVGYDELKTKIDDIRACGSTSC
ncbi:DsbA family protein [Breoghania sp.]|uniref:DsbA family protein n=1 Tax=Breoghania sp. TaxID=2065378 RepID=UPI00262349ED|nr:DsbA family protein [Breoghania sp.]MDJ0930770.1 DsbA family protein [Breoghania sp.]